MSKIIIFIDALEPNHFGGGEGWEDTKRGELDAGYPKVTPKVMSEVYTGLSPSEQGMGRAHAMGGEMPHRPMTPTIQEKLEAAGYNVISLHMPYCLPLQLQNGAWISTAMQNQQAGQNPLAQMCQQPPVNLDMLDPETDNAAVSNAKQEDLYAKVSSMLNATVSGGFDVAFLGIRSVDEYTHFQWDEKWRDKIRDQIASEIGRFQVNHDVLWFSDHGNQEKRDVFRVNKWLMEKGYLELDIDVEFAERFEDEMQNMNPRAQQGRNIENQLGPQSPGVDIQEESQAISMDPYDSCVTILDDNLSPETLRDEMMGTGMYEGVELTTERWGNGQFLESCPDLVTLRDDHVLVTGNVHPDPIGMGFYRTGVHSRYGAWGTTDESFEREQDVTPRQMHDVIWQFVTGESQVTQEARRRINQLEQGLEMAMED